MRAFARALYWPICKVGLALIGPQAMGVLNLGLISFNAVFPGPGGVNVINNSNFKGDPGLNRFASPPEFSVFPSQISKGLAIDNRNKALNRHRDAFSDNPSVGCVSRNRPLASETNTAVRFEDNPCFTA